MRYASPILVALLLAARCLAAPSASDESCVKCHHMNIPKDLQSACSDCHRNMYATADVFRHDWHADPDGGDIACNLCHPPGEEKQKPIVVDDDTESYIRAYTFPTSSENGKKEPAAESESHPSTSPPPVEDETDQYIEGQIGN